MMKIGQTGAAPAVSHVAGGSAGTSESQGTGKPAKAGSAGAPAGGSTEVKISSAAKALLDGSDGGFDQAKVDRVRQSISDGTYKINPEAIADKLIANAHEVLGKVNQGR
jgi:negative regulator of flagellin synthesis FlgM